MKADSKTAPHIILLVEDEVSLRRSITFTLLRQGHCVVPFGTVDEALAFLFENDAPDRRLVLIITDLQLPGKDGIDLVRRAKSGYPEIPVLIITGHGSREARRELEQIGVTEILDKPFDIAELVVKVTSMLGTVERC